MENIIKQIIDIDKTAQEKIDAAYKQKAEEEKHIAEDIDENRSKLDDRAHSRLEKLQSIENDYAQQKIDVIMRHKEEVLNQLQEQYDQNHLMWEDDLYGRVLHNAADE